MCGICGVFQIRGEPRPVIAAEALDRMTDVMTHRGPDDRGTHRALGVALGARRLSIVDVAGGHQPVKNEDESVWAIQNGELYNHVDIRNELARKGHRFESRCDTDVLPHLYETVGPSFAERLRGKFAIAVWDQRHRRGILARDRLGVKPLYYAEVDHLLVFASELKSLLSSGLITPELDMEAIDAYLSFGFIPGPRTPIAGVHKLLPGHRLVVSDDVVRVERYWQLPEPRPIDDERAPSEWADELRALLDEAVRLRLMSDVPLGAMLSGGLDSSLVVALMAQHVSGPVQTFSVGFRDAGIANELADARFVADLFGTEHHELELSVNDQSVDLAELAWVTDEPLADLSTLGFLALSELASRHVTVALSGQGADELLGGYSRHRNAALVDRFEAIPRAFQNGALLFARRGSPTLAKLREITRAQDPVDRLLAVKSGAYAQLRDELAGGTLALLDGQAARRAVEVRKSKRKSPLLPQVLHLDAQLGLVDDMLHYFDRASMARSLEVRVPFLDHVLVEFCVGIPPGLKVRRGTTKYVLREAARGIVPDRIIDKPKIGFFNGFVEAWFRGQADNTIRDYLLQPAPRYADFLNRAPVERLVRSEPGQRTAAESDLLLSILMLEVWLSTYIPRALPVSSAADGVRNRILA
jgi:asparagine synthase (glutamine-hydrolysing)